MNLHEINYQRVTATPFESVGVTFVSLALYTHKIAVKVGVTTPKVPL